MLSTNPPTPPTETSPQPASREYGASSVRQRGRESPVELRQIAADSVEAPEAVGADPGDGPPPARKNQKSAREEQTDKDAGNTNIRMWPMLADSYTFTQPFGPVPQIAHFYQPGAGCPADRPVVHTGLDLAAPEGTPFYAAASGWVTESGYDREVGVANTRIIIQHEGRNDGYATEYLHWIASLFVDVGEHVEAGQLIGEVGSVGYSTGPHFSLIDLDTGEHIDPTRWLPKEPGTEGYRGITPRRAAMRLPAGTTAGCPNTPTPPLQTRRRVRICQQRRTQARTTRGTRARRRSSAKSGATRTGTTARRTRKTFLARMARRARTARQPLVTSRPTAKRPAPASGSGTGMAPRNRRTPVARIPLEPRARSAGSRTPGATVPPGRTTSAPPARRRIPFNKLTRGTRGTTTRTAMAAEVAHQEQEGPPAGRHPAGRRRIVCACG